MSNSIRTLVVMGVASALMTGTMAFGQLGKTAAPGAKAPKAGEPVAILQTEKGDIVLKFFPKVAPGHVKNFLTLAKKGFYDGTKFHRTIPGFMIQGGDPNTKTPNRAAWGTGGPGYEIKGEMNATPHTRGILSMARSQARDSAGSQFFITVADAFFLNPSSQSDGYTVFGQVLSGMDAVDKIVAGPTQGDIAVNPVAIKKVIIAKWPVKVH